MIFPAECKAVEAKKTFTKKPLKNRLSKVLG